MIPDRLQKIIYTKKPLCLVDLPSTAEWESTAAITTTKALVQTTAFIFESILALYKAELHSVRSEF